MSQDKDSNEYRLEQLRRDMNGGRDLLQEKRDRQLSRRYPDLSEDDICQLIQHVTEALREVDEISTAERYEVTYETMQRNRFSRKEGWTKKYTLLEARSAARTAAMQLRKAWSILDPIK